VLCTGPKPKPVSQFKIKGQMKKFQALGRTLSSSEMRTISGGDEPPESVIGDETSTCNAYCGSGSKVTCSGRCATCENAGNAYNPYVAGGDKICS
jgi:hypothetical protein